MLIPEALVHAVIESTDIVDVARDYVTLEPCGAHYKGRCCFHEEQTPSFVVSPARQMFVCFGCHTQGNVFLLVMHMHRVDFAEAVAHLAGRAGIVLPWGDDAESE